MDHPNQPTGNRPNRPGTQPGGAPRPLQRSNYGLPPRPTTSQRPPSGARMMDFAPTRPQQPAPHKPQPSLQHAPPRPNHAQRPSHAPRTAAGAPSAQGAPRSKRILLGFAKFILIVLAAALLLGGAARWFTAGTTEGAAIATGTVIASENNVTSIQFKNTDDTQHVYVKEGSSKVGSTVDLAFSPDAPEVTARTVASVRNAHILAVVMVVFGITCIIALIVLRFHSHGHRR